MTTRLCVLLRGVVLLLAAVLQAQHASVMAYCTHFNMSSAGMTDVTRDTFTNCTAAEIVNISFNSITFLPNDTFDGFYRLKTLDISHNNISEILPGTLFGLRRLENLYFTHNGLTTLPMDIFSNKPLLETVNLSYNRLTNIPLPVFNVSLPNLRRVILQHNALTAYEPWGYIRDSIDYIDLRWNPVYTATNDYGWTYDGRSVYDQVLTDLRNTALTDWNDTFFMQYKVPQRDAHIDTIMFEMQADIRDNNLVCDCHVHNLANRFRKSMFRWNDNPLLHFRCGSPPEFRQKRLIYDIPLHNLVCNITTGCPTGCRCQDRPEEAVISVDCKRGNLTEVPKTIPDNKYGRINLNLENNDISRLENMSYAKDILTLKMANNALNYINKTVMKEIAGKEGVHVDFTNNALTGLPEEIQNIKFQNTKLGGNDLQCTCNMLWMKSWMALAPRYGDRSLQCVFEGSSYTILDLDEDILKCNDAGSIVLIVVLVVCFVLVVALIITIKRCPYETKVILFKIFRIHPADRYAVDDTDKEYDVYVSFDDDDYYVRQWVRKVLVKQLEEKKPRYKLSIGMRNKGTGAEADARLDLIDNSRRLLIILTEGYTKHQWCDYEVNHSENLNQHDGRVLYILYDNNAEELAKREPWELKMKDRKVFRLNDKMLWSKIRYELPRKSAVKKHVVNNANHEEVINIDI